MPEGENITWKKVKDGITLQAIRDSGSLLEDVIDTENENKI